MKLTDLGGRNYTWISGQSQRRLLCQLQEQSHNVVVKSMTSGAMNYGPSMGNQMTLASY